MSFISYSFSSRNLVWLQLEKLMSSQKSYHIQRLFSKIWLESLLHYAFSIPRICFYCEIVQVCAAYLHPKIQQTKIALWKFSSLCQSEPIYEGRLKFILLLQVAMTLNLPLFYWFWLVEYCQTSPNKKQITKPLTRNKNLSLLYFWLTRFITKHFH